ncbi:MAG: hypothetical protein JNJ46_10140 [Myxococcales bacterium]|nr:hypothetical protein [Myxococcales bacterium]
MYKTSSALVSLFSSLLLASAACGPAEQDSRGQDQQGSGESTTLIIGGGSTDFTVNKPIINRVWGSSDKDVWAAGNDGNMIHWDGKAWRRIAVPTGNDLLGIWGASDKDVWAVGEAGVVIHWDGSAWSRVTSPVPDSAALNDVWGTSGNNIWAVGDRGVVMQYNGSAWGAISLPQINNLLTVWASGTSDAWIGGDLGLLLRWDGSSWSEVASGSAAAYVAIRGTASNKVWASKQNREVWIFDGTKWTRSTAIGGSKLWMTADNDIWVYDNSSAAHYTTMWSSANFGTLSAVWSSSPISAWAFTPNEIYRLTTAGWNATW